MLLRTNKLRELNYAILGLKPWCKKKETGTELEKVLVGHVLNRKRNGKDVESKLRSG